MGNFCGKPPAIKYGGDEFQSQRERKLARGSSELYVPRGVSSRRQESFRVKKKSISGEIKFQLVDRKANGSRKVRDDYYEKNGVNSEVVNNYPGAGTIPKATEGEQVAAGWPSWLASAAGEAVKGWLPRKADTFEKLDKIGQGTYSSVYKARDLTNNKVVALKRVRFDNMDCESVKFMAREILILRRLDHPNIIKLEGLVTSRSSSSLYLVLEYMEHDLTGLASLPGVKFTEPQVKCYMQQLLSGLDHCHSHGVLHRDIKGSNLLIDNHGILKIADFGLASFYDRHRKIPLTSRVVTLWYRPPELLLGSSHYGVAIDLWSTGCILGELYSGKPIMPGRTEVEQLHKIFKLCGSPSDDYWKKAKLPHSTVFKPHQPYKGRLTETFKDLPAAAVSLMETLLNIDPACRGTAAAALKSEFFRTEPFACDPLSLPQYPPSKEIDAKLREEEAKRQGTLGVRGMRNDREMRGRTVSVRNVNAELVQAVKRPAGQCNSKSRGEAFNAHKDEAAAASGFPVDPPAGSSQVAKETCRGISGQPPPQRVSYSGPLGDPSVRWTAPGKRYDDASLVSTRSDLSSLSGLVASRTLGPDDDTHDKYGCSSRTETTDEVKRMSEICRERPRRQQDHMRQSSHNPETGRASMKGPRMQGNSSSGNKIHFSGPLLVSSSKVDQMLKDHDRRLEEAARRTRLEKTRASKFPEQELQMAANPVYGGIY